MKKITLVFSTFSFVSAAIASSMLSVDTSPALAQTAGCGSGWSNTALKYLSPVGSRQFRVACDEHDACYDTFGKSKQACDKAFHNRMLGMCARDHNTWVGKPLKIACNGRSDSYYTGVLEGGQDKYDKAQAAATPSPQLVLTFDARFRAVSDWSVRNGYISGFPNFHQANYGQGVVFGVIALKPGAAEPRDVPMAELGNPKTNEERFRAVSDWSVRNGYISGFPNFHQANYGQGVVFGVIALKPGAAEPRDVLLTDLGNPRTNEELFRAVSDWSVRNGYISGFPNFHQRMTPAGVVFGVIALKSQVAEPRDAPIRDLR